MRQKRRLVARSRRATSPNWSYTSPTLPGKFEAFPDVEWQSIKGKRRKKRWSRVCTIQRPSEERASSLSLKTRHRRPRLASHLSDGTQSDPTIFRVTTAIMITTSNSLLRGSGRSNPDGGDLLHTLDVVGLFRVPTEFHSLLIIPLRAPHPVERDR